MTKPDALPGQSTLPEDEPEEVILPDGSSVSPEEAAELPPPPEPRRRRPEGERIREERPERPKAKPRAIPELEPEKPKPERRPVVAEERTNADREPALPEVVREEHARVQGIYERAFARARSGQLTDADVSDLADLAGQLAVRSRYRLSRRPARAKKQAEKGEERPRYASPGGRYA